MTFTRRIEKGDSIYVYRVKTYREKGTGKVKQKTKYLGKEVKKGGKTVFLPPKHRRVGVKKILSFGSPVALHRLADEFGLPRIIDNAVEGCTRITDAGNKIIALATNKVLSNDGIEGMSQWFCSTSLPEHTGLPADTFTPKKVRGLHALLSMENPDTIGMIEQGVLDQIKKTHPDDLSTLVYDLTDLTFYGTVNGLAKYGHAYRHNGNEKQINLVLAVTKNRKLPVHHRILPGNIVSVSTIRRFASELKASGTKDIVAVLDRGFYSKRNMEEMESAECKVIGAMPSTLNIHKEALELSKDIEYPRHYLRYKDEVLFVMEHEIEGKRLMVYHSPIKHARELEQFYTSIDERERYLKERETVKYGSKEDLLEEFAEVCKPHQQCFRCAPKKTGSEWRFSHKLLHDAVQRQTWRLGKTVLFTTTSLPTRDVLQLYREKDIVDKTFCLMKRRGLTPVNATTEETTKANGVLAILGYFLLALLGSALEGGGKTGEDSLSLEKALALLDDVKEVVYADGSKTLVDITKEQEGILDKIGVVLK